MDSEKRKTLLLLLEITDWITQYQRENRFDFEERKENSNENVKYVKKTSKNVSEKIVEMEESKEEPSYE